MYHICKRRRQRKDAHTHPSLETSLLKSNQWVWLNTDTNNSQDVRDGPDQTA